MNIVVSNNDIEYSGNFLKVSTLEEACSIRGTVDVLVYHKSDETSNDKITSLRQLKNKVKKILYICNEDDTDVAVKMMVIGSCGQYVDDDFFLESTEELNTLVESIDEVTALVELGGVNVLGDFFNRYLQNESFEFNKNYLMVVKNAVQDLLTEYNQKNLEIIHMSETATDIFSNTSILLENMKEEQKKLESMVTKLSESAKESVVLNRRPAGSSVLFYPRISYIKDRNIIRIKEIGSFRYLVSFMLGFRIYLENMKNLRPKLIFVEPVGELIEERYKMYNWVKTSSIRSSSNYYNDVVFTNCPNKDVLNKLLDDDKYDTFIVVDRTTSDKEHILNTKGSTVKYAVSGLSSINKFNLPLKDCISCMSEIRGTLFTVPMFLEYPVEHTARERFYTSEMSLNYEKLFLDVGRR